MGGFAIANGVTRLTISSNNAKQNVNPNIELYHTYTWELFQILDEQTARKQQLIVLKDATTPTFTVNKETYLAASVEYKFAKSVTWDDIKLSWYDTVGMCNYMIKWRSSVWDPKIGLSSAEHYKKKTVLRCFTPDEDNYYGWSLVNSWPSTIRYGDLTYASSDGKLVEVTLSYDWAEEFQGPGT
jgi:hypothetical protein